MWGWRSGWERERGRRRKSGLEGGRRDGREMTGCGEGERGGLNVVVGGSYIEIT